MSLVTAQDIRNAAENLEGVALFTPLFPCPWVSDEINADVVLKCENLQQAGAFKIRGAYTMMDRLSDEERARGVTTYSSGNHGQALALAASMFGVEAVIVMPTTAPAIKVQGALSYGATVVLEGTTSTERMKKSLELAHKHGYVVVPPFDHLDIITGQGTVGLEILEDWPDIETILVPIGGGGLASGVAAYVKQTKPECKIIGVEPERADAMYQSIQAGSPVTIEARGSIADGLMPVRPGDLTFAHAREFIDEILLVSEDAIRDATADLIKRSKMVVEFSGAATVAALRQHAGRFAEQRIAAVLSGGNLDPQKLSQLIA